MALAGRDRRCDRPAVQLGREPVPAAHDSSVDEVQVPVEFATRIRLQTPQRPVEHASLPLPVVEQPRYGVTAL